MEVGARRRASRRAGVAAVVLAVITLGSSPAMSIPLSGCAAMRPAAMVPWSLARAGPEQERLPTNEAPGSSLPTRSRCGGDVSIAVSSTATTTSALPWVTSHALGAPTARSSGCPPVEALPSAAAHALVRQHRSSGSVTADR